MQATLVQDIRLENIQKILKMVSRSKLCEMTGVEYNLLNQYLGKATRKRMGAIFASRIAMGLKMPADWLDEPLAEYSLLSALGMKKELNNSALKNDRAYLITQQFDMPYCDLTDSVLLNGLRCGPLESVLPQLDSWVFFRTGRTALKGVFSNSLLCCSGELNPGSQSIFLFEDGAVILAEFVYERDGYMSLTSADGVRRDFSQEGLIYGSKIELVLQMSYK